tara:strand:+ start:4903 stop:8160 length:3258 start_codon:yes stop_codon:yes gene_type:complete
MEGFPNLPPYQRDFAWKVSQMNQLWDDLVKHLLAKDQSVPDEEASRFYLGSIVTDSPLGGGLDLVDGQQRFSSLTLASCALRDGLISTGFVELAYKIHKELISDIDGNHKHPHRFKLFDKPKEGPLRHLSSERRLAPYRKRIVNIPTGMVTAKTNKGATRVQIDIDSSTDNVLWSTESGEEWLLGISDGKKILHKYRVKSDSKSRLRAGEGGNPPTHITLKEEIEEDILPGLKILIMSNVKSPMEKYSCLGPMQVSKMDKEARSRMNKIEYSEIYHPDYRRVYRYIRADVEHFIMSEKKYYPTQGITKENDSTTLRFAQQDPTCKIEHSSKPLIEGEIVNFIQETTAITDWPSEQDLLKKVNDGEAKDVEMKGCFRNPIIGGKIRTRSQWKKYDCTRVIAGMLNDQGGYLFIGVQDKTNKITGIQNENYNDDDEAAHSIIQYVTTQLGKRCEKYIDIKVIQPDPELPLKKFIAVKVSRPAKGEFYNMDFIAFNEKTDGSKIKESVIKKGAFYIKGINRTTLLKKPEEIENHKKERDQLPMNTIETSFPYKVAAFKYNSDDFYEHNLKGEILQAEGQDEILKIPEASTVSIPYLSDGRTFENDADLKHLRTPGDRAQGLYDLVTNIRFTDISFSDDSNGAVSHFMMTNDANRLTPLTTYDMISAFTQSLVTKKEGSKKTDFQRAIESKWKEISDDLYLAADKKDAEINDFFSDWLLSTNRLSKPGKRFTKKESWEGISRELNKMHSTKGIPKEAELEEFYDEMVEYARIYIRATKLDGDHWSTPPYNQTQYSLERVLLSAIRQVGQKQHIPAYVALVHRFEELKLGKDERHVITDFLRNFNYTMIRYFSIAKLLGVNNGFQANEIYQKMSGKESWIVQIMYADLSDKNIRDQISKLPLELEFNVDDKKTYFWENTNCKKWRQLNFKGTPSRKSITHLLYSVELAMENPKPKDVPKGKQNEWKSANTPSASRFFSMKSPTLEHIMPVNPKELSQEYYDISKKKPKAKHSKLVFAFGNHCLLEAPKNSKAKNNDPVTKYKKGIFKSSDFKTGREVHRMINKNQEWSEVEIEKNSRKMIKSLIDYYTPS